MRVLATVMMLACASPGVANAWTDKAHWRMDETFGNVVSDDVAGLIGTAVNAAIAPSGCVAGSPCRSFNGSSSHVHVPYSTAVVDPGLNELSYGAYIKPSLPRPNNGDDIIHVSGWPAPHFKLEVNESDSPGKAKCGVRGAAQKTVSVTGGPDLYDGAWHHLECRLVRSPKEYLELWVDGVLVASVRGQVGNLVTGEPILLGKHSTTEAGRYSGLMDDVRIRWKAP